MMADSVFSNYDYNLLNVTANDTDVITLQPSFFCHVKLFQFVLIYFYYDPGRVFSTFFPLFWQTKEKVWIEREEESKGRGGGGGVMREVERANVVN